MFRRWKAWCTTVRIEKTLFYLWICPGLPVCYVLRNALWWVVLMSAYAIIMGHRSTWVAARAEEAIKESGTPGEPGPLSGTGRRSSCE